MNISDDELRPSPDDDLITDTDTMTSLYGLLFDSVRRPITVRNVLQRIELWTYLYRSDDGIYPLWNDGFQPRYCLHEIKKTFGLDLDDNVTRKQLRNIAHELFA